MDKREAYKVAEKMISQGIKWPKIINLTNLEINDLKRIQHSCNFENKLKS